MCSHYTVVFIILTMGFLLNLSIDDSCKRQNGRLTFNIFLKNSINIKYYTANGLFGIKNVIRYLTSEIYYTLLLYESYIAYKKKQK